MTFAMECWNVLFFPEGPYKALVEIILIYAVLDIGNIVRL